MMCKGERSAICFFLTPVSQLSVSSGAEKDSPFAFEETDQVYPLSDIFSRELPVV